VTGAEITRLSLAYMQRERGDAKRRVERGAATAAGVWFLIARVWMNAWMEIITTTRLTAAVGGINKRGKTRAARGRTV
jgi:hypothetical protein